MGDTHCNRPGVGIEECVETGALVGPLEAPARSVLVAEKRCFPPRQAQDSRPPNGQASEQPHAVSPSGLCKDRGEPGGTGDQVELVNSARSPFAAINFLQPDDVSPHSRDLASEV